MKKFIVTLLSLFSASLFAASAIVGAGATFPAPLYAKWAENYHQQTGVGLNYQPIGSGGGIKQIQMGTVDFGASDKPLSATALNENKLIQFPIVIGGVVPVFNLPGIKSGQLTLSGSLLAEIYLGKIKKWNDPKIKALNLNVVLPDTLITVVHRSDGSGTTFLFTDYLNKVSEDWKKQIGSDTAVSWPTGIGGKGNEGVASYVQRVKGSIGYVEYIYAQQNGFSYAQLMNKSGEVVSPSLKTFQAASLNAHWNSKTQFSEILTDESGKDSWPITGTTFILMHQIQKDSERARAVLKFFDWAYTDGKALTTKMDYVPLPDQTMQAIETYWKENIKDKSGNPIWQ